MTGDGAYTGRTETPRSQTGGEGGSPIPTPAPSASQGHEVEHGSAEQPWLTILIAGFGLFGISAILRYSLAPRAG